MPALGRTLDLGFKSLAWLNGIGIGVVLASSAGVLPLELATVWLRFPLAVFLGGLALALLGLLWSFPLMNSLDARLVTGRRSPLHWIPLACTLLAYILSLAAFAAGCWFFQLLLESVAVY